MCRACEKEDAKLRFIIEHHDHAKCDSGCPVPAVDPLESVFYHATRAHVRIDETMVRMERTRGIVESPDQIPSQLLRDWEMHLIEAAECMGRARRARELKEGEIAVRDYVNNLAVKGQPS